MTLIKTSFLTFIATAIKMLSSLVINKAIAVYIGPTGLALVGQFQNFIQLLLTAAQGALTSGVTKYTAEYGKDDPRTPLLLSSASKISLITSVIVGTIVVIFSDVASIHILKSDSNGYIFVIFGFTLVLFVINNLLLSILNGLKEIKKWVVINIIQSIYSLIFTTAFVVYLGLDGALIALVTNQSVILIVVLWMLRNHPVIKLDNFKEKLNYVEAKKLSGYVAMALTTALTVPVSHMLIRNYIGENLSWDDAGYWQALSYISTMYLSVITTALSIYYLPRLSEIKDREALKFEVKNGYKLILPLVFFLSFSIFMLKDLIINIVFSEDFIPMRELFLWQLVGDFLKMASWIIAYIMIAKAMKKLFILTELFFSVLLVFASIIFVNIFGLVGVTYAYTLNYFIYIFVIYNFVKVHWK